VAATTQANQWATFSNWGYYVDIAAPGENLWSTLARNYVRDASNDLLFQFLYGWNGIDPYMYGSGTSYACPVVVGAGALVRGGHPGVPARSEEDRPIRVTALCATGVDGAGVTGASCGARAQPAVARRSEAVRRRRMAY